MRELTHRIAQTSELARGRMGRLGEIDLASRDVLIDVVRALEEQQWILRAQLGPKPDRDPQRPSRSAVLALPGGSLPLTRCRATRSGPATDPAPLSHSGGSAPVKKAVSIVTDDVASAPDSGSVQARRPIESIVPLGDAQRA